jgi:hypothetical protein
MRQRAGRCYLVPDRTRSKFNDACLFDLADRHSVQLSIYWFLIHRATVWCHTSVMRVPIKSGVDVNIEDEDGGFSITFCRSSLLAGKWDHFEAAESRQFLCLLCSRKE